MGNKGLYGLFRSLVPVEVVWHNSLFALECGAACLVWKYSYPWGKMTSKVPRATIKKIVKANEPDARMSTGADLILYLDYVLFIKRLAHEATIEAQGRGDAVITEDHIQAVTKGL